MHLACACLFSINCRMDKVKSATMQTLWCFGVTWLCLVYAHCLVKALTELRALLALPAVADVPHQWLACVP